MFKAFFKKLWPGGFSGNGAYFTINNPDFPQQARAAVVMARTGSPIGDPREAAMLQYLGSTGGRI